MNTAFTLAFLYSFLWPVGGEHTASAASGQQQLTLLLHIFARLSDFFHIYWEIIKIVLS